MKKPWIIAIVVGTILVVSLTLSLSLYFTLGGKASVTPTSNDGSAGTIQLAVQHLDEAKQSSSLEASTTIDPTYLGIKFVSAYLAEDVDPDTQSNKGNTQMIYLNPACTGGIGNCGVEATNLNTNADPKVGYVQIQDYFDFSKPSEQVGAELSAQKLPVLPGTYRYVRLEFCRSVNDTISNYKFQTADMKEPHLFSLSSCAVTSAIEPPLEVKEGDNIVLSLHYTSKGTVAVQSDTNSPAKSCASVEGHLNCLTPPIFEPRVTKLV